MNIKLFNIGGKVKPLVREFKTLPYKRRLAYLETGSGQYVVIPITGGNTSGYELNYATFENSNYKQIFAGNVRNTQQKVWIYKLSDNFGKVNIGEYRLIKRDEEGNKYLNGNLIGRDSFYQFTWGDGVWHLGRSRSEGSPTHIKFDALKCWKDGKLLIDAIPVMSCDDTPEFFNQVTGTFLERNGEFLYGEL